jgi:hypothetical protein
MPPAKASPANASSPSYWCAASAPPPVPTSSGTASSTGWRCGYSPRALVPTSASTATTGARVGCIWVMLVPSGWRQRGSWRRRPCCKSPRALTRQRSGAPCAPRARLLSSPQRYVAEHACKHNKSWRQAEALVRRHCLPRWGKLQPTTITRADVRTMLAPIAASSAVRVYCVTPAPLPFAC